jgi:phosphatidylserine decarboxylase
MANNNQIPHTSYHFLNSLKHHAQQQPNCSPSEAIETEQLHPTLEAFKAFIQTDATIRHLFQQMFEDAAPTPTFGHDPNRQPGIRDYTTMLHVFNTLMKRAPRWQYTSSGQKELVGFPFNAVLAYPMATSAGLKLFSRLDVNAHIRNILKSWSMFLDSPDSISVLNDGPEGWLCEEALEAMSQVVTDATPTSPTTFTRAYICDPAAPSYSYKSWDDFFTRRWRAGIRPIASPENDDVICNTCESSPYRIAYNVKLKDDFSLKSQPYSLVEMLNNDPLAPQFEGGIVYQAFLSALSYHRWHAPVTGEVVKIVHIPGTYFLQNSFEGFANKTPSGDPDPDPAPPNRSQAFLCQKATRLLIFIQADNEKVGLIAVLLVGMAEVSSCEAFVKEGQSIKKGEEIGTFHYGGSTHCLIFRPQIRLRLLAREPFGKANVPVCSALAILESDTSMLGKGGEWDVGTARGGKGILPQILSGGLSQCLQVGVAKVLLSYMLMFCSGLWVFGYIGDKSTYQAR